MESNTPFLTRLKHHFGEMDFFYQEKYFGSGQQKKKNTWVLLVYFLLALGIFSRQVTQFPVIDLNLDNVRWTVLVASLIVGLAVLPYLMRRISRRSKGKPKLEHIIGAFGFGFFLDFANSQTMNLISKYFQ